MKTYTDAEAAWQRARDLAREGDTAGAAELVVEVAAFYERGRFLVRARAASEALNRVLTAMTPKDGSLDEPERGPMAVWAVLDDFQLGPGEHGRLQRLLDG